MAGPVITSSDSRSKTMLLFAGGILATFALVAGVVVLWPGDDDSDVEIGAAATTTSADLD